MSEMLLVWSGIFLVLLVVFLAILYKAKKRKMYLLLFIFGMVFGFYFDTLSVAMGHYSYAQLFLNVFGVPLSMIIAEGFAVVITVRIFETAKSFLKR